jgi:hypothetical protein
MGEGVLPSVGSQDDPDLLLAIWHTFGHVPIIDRTPLSYAVEARELAAAAHQVAAS